MKPFTFNSSLTNNQKVFNYHLSKARIVVENAFGRLKARWRWLTKRNDMNISNTPHIVTACCILHNICEMFGDRVHDANDVADQPLTISTGDRVETDVKEIRNTLVQYYNQN